MVIYWDPLCIVALRSRARSSWGREPGPGASPPRPLGHFDLELHEVESGDHFSHRMFELEPSIHLEKAEGSVGVEEKLDGARTLIVHRGSRRNRSLSQPRAERFVDCR